MKIQLRKYAEGYSKCAYDDSGECHIKYIGRKMETPFEYDLRERALNREMRILYSEENNKLMEELLKLKYQEYLQIEKAKPTFWQKLKQLINNK